MDWLRLMIDSANKLSDSLAMRTSCPVCGAYRIESVYEPDIGREPPYVNVCESCEWKDVDEALAPAAIKD